MRVDSRIRKRGGRPKVSRVLPSRVLSLPSLLCPRSRDREDCDLPLSHTSHLPNSFVVFVRICRMAHLFLLHTSPWLTVRIAYAMRQPPGGVEHSVLVGAHRDMGDNSHFRNTHSAIGIKHTRLWISFFLFEKENISERQVMFSRVP